MLDIRLIRERPDFVIERLSARGGSEIEASIKELLSIDSQRRALETQVQTAQADRNRLSKSIGAARAKGENSSEIEAQVKRLGEDMAAINEDLEKFNQRQQRLLLELPNIPHESVAEGKSAADNPVIRSWSEKASFDFKPQGHLEIGQKLGLFDLERAAKISGSGFIYWTDRGARLERGIINFLLDLHTREHGYREASPPFIVKRDCMIGTAQLPKFEEEAYATEDHSMFLIPTAEVPLTNFHREEILSAAELPKKFVAYTPCFRREAGSAGRETRGIIRVHQFDKVELVKITTPETSYAEHEKLLQDAEKVLQLLGLHYRVISLCTGDMGLLSAKTYDIEVWAPGQEAYLEVSSCSNYEDYQARRMNLRFKDPETGKNRFCHTLNGSGTALPRLVVALLETYQQKNGSVKIPEPLQDYVKMKEIGV